MAESFKASSLHKIDVATIGLKDIFNAAELFVAASRRKDSEELKLTHGLNEATWRASVDGLIENLCAFGATAPIVS
jgi:hypothetical protein